MAVGGADPPIGHPPDEVLGLDVDEDRPLDAATRLGQRPVEGLGLDARPREPVEDRADLGIGLLESIEEDPDHRLVRNELAATHVPIRFATQRRARGGSRSQEVTGGEDRHAQRFRQDRRLGPLPRARGSQENDDGHSVAQRAPSVAGRGNLIG